MELKKLIKIIGCGGVGMVKSNPPGPLYKGELERRIGFELYRCLGFIKAYKNY